MHGSLETLAIIRREHGTLETLAIIRRDKKRNQEKRKSGSCSAIFPLRLCVG
jgi:hypothetical protein